MNGHSLQREKIKMGLEVVPKLGKILKERNITQMQFAEMCNINQSTISRFDRNKQHNDEHLFIIAKKLNLHIEDLFEIKEVEEQKEPLSE